MDIKLTILLLIISSIIGLSHFSDDETWGVRFKPIRVKIISRTRREMKLFDP